MQQKTSCCSKSFVRPSKEQTW